mmetsp:Transcript_67801/g.210638  ORF Transcript_67801/g.210638 Transcript_67801/m.210638 type:complete len:350 (+) Transcript_67801:134-1183(+)
MRSTPTTQFGSLGSTCTVLQSQGSTPGPRTGLVQHLLCSPVLAGLRPSPEAGDHNLVQRMERVLRSCQEQLSHVRRQKSDLRSKCSLLAQSLQQAESNMLRLKNDWCAVREELDSIQQAMAQNERALTPRCLSGGRWQGHREQQRSARRGRSVGMRAPWPVTARGGACAPLPPEASRASTSAPGATVGAVQAESLRALVEELAAAHRATRVLGVTAAAQAGSQAGCGSGTGTEGHAPACQVAGAGLSQWSHGALLQAADVSVEEHCLALEAELVRASQELHKRAGFSCSPATGSTADVDAGAGPEPAACWQASHCTRRLVTFTDQPCSDERAGAAGIASIVSGCLALEP